MAQTDTKYQSESKVQFDPKIILPNYTQLLWALDFRPNKKKLKIIFQTFPKFVEILSKNGFGYKYVPDHHITPFWIKCRICYLNYSYIGKMETFQQDAKFIAKKVRLLTHCYKIHFLFQKFNFKNLDFFCSIFGQNLNL